MSKNRFYVFVAFFCVFALHLAYSVNRSMQIYSDWVQMQNVNFVVLYFQRLDFFLGLSYALAVAFTVYAVTQFVSLNRNCLKGVVGGVTLTGAIYFFGCFLIGCCGSPMLIVYMGLLGPKFLGVTKPLVFLFTAISVLVGFYWIKRKAKSIDGCCLPKKKESL